MRMLLDRLRVLIVICTACLALAATGCGKTIVYDGGPARQPAPAPQKKAPTKSKPYVINGKKYYPLDTADGYSERGVASWYGKDFHGKKTANGEIYNMYAMTAAHKILPLGTNVRVTNLVNGKSIDVRVNDRGPFVRGRIIDLSYTAAKRLDMIGSGTAHVLVESLTRVPRDKDGNILGRYYIQVGSFTMKKNALTLMHKMRSRGYSQVRMTEAWVKGKHFWRVQAGVFPNHAKALQALAQLEQEFPSSFVIAD